MVSLSDQEREQIASCVWSAGSRTRSPLLPILLSEIDQIVARHVAAALEQAADSIERRIAKNIGGHPYTAQDRGLAQAERIVRAQIHN